jgi:NitT/TauT family transport system permease protein
MTVAADTTGRSVPGGDAGLAGDGSRPGAPVRQRRAGRGVLYAVAPALGLIVLFGGWELFVRVFDIPPFELPAPSQVLSHMADDPGFYLREAWVTGTRAALGLTIGLAAGLAIGTPMALSRIAERAITPVVVLIQVTPVTAYAPALVVWHVGLRPILATTALLTFVPFSFGALVGLRSVEPATLELLRSVDASHRQVFFRLRVPNALPSLFAAARIAIGLALVGTTLAEFFALVPDGLGVAIRKAQNFNDVYQLWGSVFTLALMGSLAVGAVVAVERSVLRWHSSQLTS